MAERDGALNAELERPLPPELERPLPLGHKRNNGAIVGRQPETTSTAGSTAVKLITVVSSITYCQHCRGYSGAVLIHVMSPSRRVKRIANRTMAFITELDQELSVTAALLIK